MRSSIWKGSISFGLLNIPVSLQTANEENDLHFSMLDPKNMAHVKFKRVNEETGREVPYDRIVKGYEYEKGRFVIMNDRDFREANVKATQTVDVEDFIPLEEIDFMLFDKPYYLVPQKGGEKGYFLLRDALEKTGKVAVGKIVIRTKQHLAAIMPREDYLILEILRFAHEVKEIHEVDYLDDVKKANYSPKELKMAEQLIKGMSSKWDPKKYKDTYYQDLMKRIERKVAAGGTKDIEPKEKPEKITATKASDLLPLLRQSLESRKGKKSRAVAHPTHSGRH